MTPSACRAQRVRFGEEGVGLSEFPEADPASVASRGISGRASEEAERPHGLWVRNESFCGLETGPSALSYHHKYMPCALNLPDDPLSLREWKHTAFVLPIASS